MRVLGICSSAAFYMGATLTSWTSFSIGRTVNRRQHLTSMTTTQHLHRIAAEGWNEAVAECLGMKIIEVQRMQINDALCKMFTNALHSSEAQAAVVLSDPVLRHWLSSTETSTTSSHVVDFRRDLLAGIRCRWHLVVEDMASLIPMVASEVIVVFPELLNEGECALVSEGSELRILAKEASGDAQDILRESKGLARRDEGPSLIERVMARAARGGRWAASRDVRRAAHRTGRQGAAVDRVLRLRLRLRRVLRLRLRLHRVLGLVAAAVAGSPRALSASGAAGVARASGAVGSPASSVYSSAMVRSPVPPASSGYSDSPRASPSTVTSPASPPGAASGASPSPVPPASLGDSSRAASVGAASPIVTAALWDSYARASQKDFTEGVKRGEQVEFYRFVCSQGLKLDFIPATKNVLTTAITSVGKLVDFVAAVEPGVFVVHAGQDLDEHCFALVVGDDGRGQVAEDFNEAKSPPCVLEPLSNLEWIEQVYSIRRIRATSNSFKGRRMKRMKLM
ncbi:hypothetical protein BBJ28_00001030 [Nothophytophthora sp. Chile5]|nr:hypothetical protein BBJ28_00001030 [Nothophytophthora sp. Chile5]